MKIGNKAFYQDNPYLDYWKKEIDDESLNKEVINCLLSKGRFARILDVGTGSGTQIRRNIELGLLRSGGEIIGLDINKLNLQNSIKSFKDWAKKKSYKLEKIKDSQCVHSFFIKDGRKKYVVKLYDFSVYDLLKKNSFGKFKLVTALSLFEHTEMERALKSIKKIVKKGGFLLAQINYDQHTIFGPTPIESQVVEARLMRLFNYVSIDNQFRGGVNYGNSSCGSLLPFYCKKVGLKVLSYGASDWVIMPGKVLTYTVNKRNVMNFFLNAFYQVLKGAKKSIKKKFNVTDDMISRWYKLRMKQLKSGELYYSCMQKDILCIK